jgi:hypothetical protein
VDLPYLAGSDSFIAPPVNAPASVWQTTPRPASGTPGQDPSMRPVPKKPATSAAHSISAEPCTFAYEGGLVRAGTL